MNALKDYIAWPWGARFKHSPKLRVQVNNFLNSGTDCTHSLKSLLWLAPGDLIFLEFNSPALNPQPTQKNLMKAAALPPLRAWITFLALAFTFVGCASIRQDKLKTFADGVNTAKTQADMAFTAVNTLTSDAVIDYAAKQPTLDDKYFFDLLDSTSIAKWDASFLALEKYSQSLILLTGTDITKNYRDATVQLASQITDTGQNLKKEGLIPSAPQMSAGVATAFAELGNIVLEAKASADARSTIQKADPTVQRIFTKMASAIGRTENEGIRGTVYSHWELIKGAKKVDFLEGDASRRRTIAAQFSDAKSKQEAQDLVLASLEKSLLALADAHHALAQKSKFEVNASVAIVKQEAKNTNDLYTQMQTAVKTKQ